MNEPYKNGSKRDYSNRQLVSLKKKMWQKVLINRNIKAVIKWLLRYPESVFSKIEDSLIRVNTSIRYPPIFIVGAPRTGSTLFYQLIARRFRVCYFSNFMMTLPKATVCLAKLAAIFDGCDPPNYFGSAYGYTFGWRSPNQGGRFWDCWFPVNDTYINPNEIPESTIFRIRNSIGAIEEIFGSPFINKWQRNSARLLALFKIFPEALFIWMRRRPEFAARSILDSRRRFFGDEDVWFSTIPPNYQEIKNGTPLEQVCNQVYHLEKMIERNLAKIGKDRFLVIQYEELVEKPQLVSEDVREFFKRSGEGHALEARHDIPNRFYNANKKWVGEPKLGLIKEYLMRLRESEYL